MKLLYAPNSPYARKCRVILREKGLVDRVEEVLTMPMDNPAELIAINPLGAVPALLAGEGRAFCDSPIICEFLDSLQSDAPSLFPGPGRDRWDILALASLADGLMDAAVQIVLENRKPEGQRSQSWIDRKQEAILRTIGLIAHRRFDPQVFNISTIGVVCALDYVRFRLPYLDWQGRHPELAQWLEKAVQRPSFSATAPQP